MIRMARIVRALRRHFERWDRPSRIAFSIAVLLLFLAALNLVFGPQETRQPTLLGFFGLMIITQVIFMWANRGMVTPFTRAQRLYLSEDFEAVCTILEELHAAGKASERELALLGNAYRQRGMLQASEVVFRQALEIQPKHHFSLYGFGRTLLIAGRYSEAVQVFMQALEVEELAVARFSLGEALFRAGQHDEARAQLENALAGLSEPPYRLMTAYLLYELKGGPVPDKSMLDEGLVFWQAQMERYPHTAYGRALSGDVLAMQIMLEEA